MRKNIHAETWQGSLTDLLKMVYEPTIEDGLQEMKIYKNFRGPLEIPITSQELKGIKEYNTFKNTVRQTKK